jgi:hypothetical protein
MRMVLRVFRVNRCMIWWTCHWITEFVFFWLRNFEYFWIVTIGNLELMVCLVTFVSNTFWPWLRQSTFRLLHKLLLLRWISILTLLKDFWIRCLIFIEFILHISIIIILNISVNFYLLTHNMVVFSSYFDIMPGSFDKTSFSWIILFVLNIIIPCQKSFERNIRLSRFIGLYLIISHLNVFLTIFNLLCSIFRRNILFFFFYPPFLVIAYFQDVTGLFSNAHLRIGSLLVIFDVLF